MDFRFNTINKKLSEQVWVFRVLQLRQKMVSWLWHGSWAEALWTVKDCCTSETSSVRSTGLPYVQPNSFRYSMIQTLNFKLVRCYVKLILIDSGGDRSMQRAHTAEDFT